MKKLYEFLYSKGIFVRTTKIFMALAVFGFTWSSAHAQTSYCTPVYTSTGDYTSSITTVGAVTNISYSASSQPTGGYADETAQVFESYETQTFDINTTYVGGSNTMYIWVDWNNDFTFDASELVDSYSPNASQTISFTVPAGTAMGDYRMRIRSRFGTTAIDACESTSWGSAVDFTLSIVAPPSCLSPTNLASNNITSSSVDIQWTANNSETSWNISWGNPGYTPGDGNEVGSATGVTTNPYQITGLNGTTSYDIYVQADCGGGDESFWVGPLTVTTLCDPFVAPFFEDFNAGALPNCWDNLSSDPSTSADNFWKFTGTPGYGASSNGKTAGTYAWVDGSSPFSDSIMLITPLIDISALTVPALSFEWFGNNTDNPGDHNPFVVSVHDGTQWHFIDSLDGDSPEWRERLYDLSPYAGNLIQVRFMVNNALLGSTLAYYQDILLDDVRIDEMPTCPNPLDLQVDAATFSSIDISWEAGYSETSWNISWGNPGYTPGDGDELGTDVSTSTTYQITGLTEDTHYDVYVQADCGGDESNWVGPLSVYTGYCVPTSTGNTTRYIDGVVTQGALMNINNTGTGLSPDAYGDYTGTDTLRVFPGQEISVEFTHPSTTYHYKIWVDWDSDLNFDGPNDLIYATTSYQSSPHLVDITIPTLTPEGVYRMRVRNSSTTLGGPCGNNASSETEDYILHVVAPPSCLPVTDIVTSNYTTTSADIEWTAVGSETTWNVSWGIPGYTPGDGNEVGSATGVTTNPYQITGLTPDTDYEVYVQADCGAGDESMWAGPITIQTFCEAIPALGFCEDFEDESTLGCWGVIDNNQDGDAWQMYTGYANSGNQSAGIHTDFNNGDNDDYLILPRMTLTGNEVMSFYYRARSVGEPNDFRVVLSTTGISPADFDEEVMALMQVSNTTYKDTVVDLSAYTGDVYIAFHVPPGGLDGYYLYIDDVCIDICVPEAGVNGTAEICREDGSIDLNTVITSDYTHGTWSFPANEGLVNGSTLATGVLPSGTYEAIYVVEGGCTSDTTVATIDVFGPSSAGTGGVITVCKGAAIDLYSALSGNVDMGGDWYDYNGNLLGTSQPTAPSLGASYNYTYIASNGVCDADTAFVEVIVDASPECTSSIQEEMTVNLSVYPNPTTDVINIVNPTNISALKVEVMDMNGRIVLVEENALNNSTEASISLGKLTIGVYTLRVYNEEGQKVFKVVKR